MNRKGFTLVELMLVIVIIGIISVITIPNIMEALDDSRNESGISMEKELKKDLELYNTDMEEDLWDETKPYECQEISFADLKQINPDINLGECLLTHKKGYLTIVKTLTSNSCIESDENNQNNNEEIDDDSEEDVKTTYNYFVGVTCGKNLKKSTKAEYDESEENQIYVVEDDIDYIASKISNSTGKKGNVYYTSDGLTCGSGNDQLFTLTLKLGNNSGASFDDVAPDDYHLADGGKSYVFKSKYDVEDRTGDGIMPGQSFPPFPSIDQGSLTFVGWDDGHGHVYKSFSPNGCYNPSANVLTAKWTNDSTPDVDITNEPETSNKVTIECEEEGGIVKSYYVGKNDPKTSSTGWKDFRLESDTNRATVDITDTGTYYFACKDKQDMISNESPSLSFVQIEFRMVNGYLDNRHHTTITKIASTSKGLILPTPTANTGYTVNGSWYSDDGYSHSVGTYDREYSSSTNTVLYSKADISKFSVKVNVQNGNGSSDDKLVEYLQGIDFTISPYPNFMNPTFDCGEGVDATLTGNTLRVRNVTKNIVCNVAYHDTVKPTGATIDSTANIADHQTATLSCSDNTNVIAYYFGTEAPTSSSSYTSINNVPEFTTTKNIDENGTYYFACKDTDGNVSDPASAKFYETLFDMNNGTIEHDTVLMMEGKSFNLPTPAAALGYTTIGKWYTNDEYTEGEMVYNASYSPTKNSTLYSDSTINTSGLTINPNGGKIQIDSEVDGEEEITTTKNYIQEYNSILTYSKPTKANDVDTSEHYTISYNTDGGGDVASQTSIITKTTVYTFTNFTKSDPFYGTLSSTTAAGNYRYAPDKDVTSTITANFSHVVNTSVASVSLPSAPSKEGYTFKGWKSSVNNQVYNAGVSFTPTADTTMTAQWEINKYTVNVTVNNGVVADGEDSSKIVIHNQDVTFEVEPSLADAPGSVTCTNGQSATLTNNVVSVTQVKNHTTCTVTFKTEMTVLFNDGTLIINELPNNRDANITTHGAVVKEYEPMSASNVYYFTGDDDDHYQLWYDESQDITKVEIGHSIKPYYTKLWFYGLSNMTTGNFTNLDMSDNVDMYGMFSGAGSAVSSSFTLTGLSGWNISHVESIANMFYNAGVGASTWNIGDLSGWNTGRVTNMGNAFAGAGANASTFTVGNLDEWDTARVTEMASMFENSGHEASTWNIGDLSEWKTGHVTSMTSMFSGAGANASTWDIGDLDEWDVSNLSIVSNMFFGAGASATTWNIGDLSGWNTSNFWLMNKMFQGAGASTTTWSIGDLSGWDVSNVDQAEGVFAGAGASANEFILNLSGWNFAHYSEQSFDPPAGFANFFTNAGRSASKFELNVSNWKGIKNDVSSMFEGAGANATDWKITGLPTWNVSKVTNASKMFSGTGTHATAWNIGDLSSWNLERATSVSDMFRGISSVGSFSSIGTLKIHATNISGIFSDSTKAQATLNLYTNPTSYTGAFYNTAIATGALITVNYDASVTNIDNIIATKSYDSNVVKGSVLN